MQIKNIKRKERAIGSSDYSMKLHRVNDIGELFSASVMDRFKAIVASSPDKIAVKSPIKEITYAELDNRAEDLARAIIERQNEYSAKQHYVALLFDHGVDMVVALLATLKSGLAYLPLDAAYPVDRLTYMCKASGTRLIVTDKENAKLAARLITEGTPLIFEDVESQEKSGDASLQVQTRSSLLNDSAYLLFTSGSTGAPKGVSQTHRNLLYHTWVWVKRLSITENDRLTLQSAYSWDSSVQDIFSSLLCGATLYPYSLKKVALSHAVTWLQKEAVTVYHSTLPIFRSVTKLLESSSAELSSLRMLALGGDSVYQSDIKKFQSLFTAGCELAYAYGSTESSSTLMNVIGQDYRTERSTLDLGTSDEHVSVYLRSTTGEIAGDGELGEIVLKSEFICPGYLNIDSDGTLKTMFTQAFEKDPQNANIVHYHTGDIGKKMPNGDIALLGRKDNKLKVRGMRVELQEVEGALCLLHEVDQAVAKTFEDDEHNSYLVAYIVRESGHEKITASDMRRLLRDKLPEHAIPSKYCFLKNLPMTPNGKIDRAALNAPDSSRPELSTKYIQPSTEIQQRISEIWCAVLGLAKVGINDNFFDLGGQSISMVRVHEQIETLVNKKIPLVKLYANPTIHSISAYLHADNERNYNSSIASVLSQASRRSEIRKNNQRRKLTRIKPIEEVPEG